MGWRLAMATVALVVGTSAVEPVGAGGRAEQPTPGAPGVGDPYFPLDGNGGYDVDRYDLAIRYDPTTDLLRGTATITARSTQALSSFNLDLVGLTVLSVEVDSAPAAFHRDGAELTVVPGRALPDRSRFRAVVRYEGVPETLGGPGSGESGFIHTDDGALVVGEPDVAATWYPVNDHPSDAASYRFDITVPAGLEAVANGVLVHQRTDKRWTTWSWEATEPMAPYLATAAIGDFEIDAYREGDIRYWDAVDADLLVTPTPHTGDRVLVSLAADGSYKRLTRAIAVPPGGATMTFWVTRDSEEDWDYFFVEARTPGGSDWTTLPEASGLTSTATGSSCPSWLGVHPFLTNYQTAEGANHCSPRGGTGGWNAVSGYDPQWRQWTIDLSGYATVGAVEVSLTYASDDSVQQAGIAVDDIVVSTGEGSTSFEDDDDPLDGWRVSDPPPNSPTNHNNWRIGTQADLPRPLGDAVTAAFALQPPIIEFLAGCFGEYPFSAAGGIVDVAGFANALENQTRPIYSLDFFADPVSAELVIVHELAHQWFGNDLRLGLWRDIWLNEGFAWYAEWLWSESRGQGTAQENFDLVMAEIPADSPFWHVIVGDPGPQQLFDDAVYYRGAMTLHALRRRIGDKDFFRLLRAWVDQQSGGTVSTPEFVLLAEQIAGEELDELFQTWLYTPARPDAG